MWNIHNLSVFASSARNILNDQYQFCQSNVDYYGEFHKYSTHISKAMAKKLLNW